MTTYLYIIEQPETGAVKVGLSDNPKRRLGQLQVSNPMSLALRYTFKCPKDVAKRLEASVHCELWQNRRQGEWFLVNARIVADLIQREHEQYILEMEQHQAVQRAWFLCDDRDWTYKGNPHTSVVVLSVICWLIAVYGTLASIYTHTISGTLLDCVVLGLGLLASSCGLVMSTVLYVTWKPELKYKQAAPSKARLN